MAISRSNTKANGCISKSERLHKQTTTFTVYLYVQGFSQIIPLNLIKVFDEKELEVNVSIIVGQSIGYITV